MPRFSPRARLRPSATTTRDLAHLHKTALPCPRSIPLPFDLACWSKPVEVIGGDLLDAWPVGRQRLMLFLADVMGHDLTAAMIASAVRMDLFHARQTGLRSPAALLQQLDHGIGSLFSGHFVTAACVLVDVAAGTLTWALAGHQPILVSDGESVQSLHHRACPLGLQMDDPYSDETTALPPGGAVVLYSDGISDALGSADYPGSEVMAGLLTGLDIPAGEMVRALRRAVRPLRRTDDRSVLAVRVKASGLDGIGKRA